MFKTSELLLLCQQGKLCLIVSVKWFAVAYKNIYTYRETAVAYVFASLKLVVLDNENKGLLEFLHWSATTSQYF